MTDVVIDMVRRQDGSFMVFDPEADVEGPVPCFSCPFAVFSRDFHWGPKVEPFVDQWGKEQTRRWEEDPRDSAVLIACKQERLPAQAYVDNYAPWHKPLFTNWGGNHGKRVRAAVRRCSTGQRLIAERAILTEESEQ